MSILSQFFMKQDCFAHRLDMSPTVHESWEIRNEMQTINERPRIFNLQLKDDIIQLEFGTDLL